MKIGTVELYPWQAKSVPVLSKALLLHGAAVDCSDLGTGKTYTACAVAKDNLVESKTLVVVCPKAVRPSWENALRAVEFPEDRWKVFNYEKLKRGIPGVGGWTADRKRFVFDPSVGMVVFDEAHKLRAYELNQNCRMSIGAKLGKIPQLFLSATMAESPVHLRTVGFGLGLHNGKGFVRWAQDRGCSFDPWGSLYLKPGHAKRVNTQLNTLLFPLYGVRVRKDDIPDFPENEILAEAIDFGDNAAIRKVYEDMEDELAGLMEKIAIDKRRVQERAQIMVAQLRARQRVELLKVPGVATMVDDIIEEGRWCVVFTNFRQTLEALKLRLADHNPAEVLGGQSEQVREAEIARFQLREGGTRVILIQIQSGGAGLNLPDIYGDCPREALLFPPYSAADLRQATGRIHRATSKSRSVQRILYAANTVEDSVMAKVKGKLRNLDMINDADIASSLDNQSRLVVEDERPVK